MELCAVVSLLLAIFLSSLAFLIPWWRMCRRGRMPPGPTPLPVVGNLLQMKSGQIVKSLLKMRDIYGSVFTVYLGHRRTLVLCGYKTIKEAFIDQGDDFVARGALPCFETVFHFSGVGVTNGEEWTQLRRFCINTLRDLGMGKRSLEMHIQEEAEHLMKELRNTKGVPCDPTYLLARAPANVIFSIVVGSRFNYDDETFNKLLHCLTEGFHIMSSFWGQLYDLFPRVMDYMPGTHQKMFKLFHIIEDYVQQSLERHRETLDDNCPQDFLDCCLIKIEQEKHNPSSVFHVKNMINSLMDIIYGAIETITTTMRFGLLLLLKHPEILEKVQREIEEVVGEERNPVFDDRSKMPFTYAVLHEIQRFANVLPMGATHCVKHDTPFRDYIIKKGTNVIPMLTTSHHDPSQFHDPDHFNPGNFLDENGCFKKNDAFMPFSIGKRNCLGEGLARAEIFLFFTTLLKNFKIKSTQEPKDIDVTPVEAGFENIAPPYQMSFIPR